MKYLDIITQFAINGTPVAIEPHGEGHINETYFVCTDKGAKYILQKLNERLFADINGLMRNIELVTDHIATKNKQAGKGEKGLTLIKTNNGESYLKNGGYFRVYEFIDNATAYQIVTGAELFCESAVAFGDFQNKLADFDATRLTEIIPDFHNTKKRLADFVASVNRDSHNRAKDIKKEIDFVMQRQAYAGRIVSLLQSGEIRTRVTHNDTKLNNVMIDNITGRAVAVIDLDTVMPGSCCYDFGDSIRFGCNSAAEDEQDLDKVFFRFELFDAYTRGYLSVLKNITKTERENLAFSSVLMTYECGMRFLADYLDGDIYFRIKRKAHNLDRARTQFKLISDMEKQLDRMNKCVEAY